MTAGRCDGGTLKVGTLVPHRVGKDRRTVKALLRNLHPINLALIGLLALSWAQALKMLETVSHCMLRTSLLGLPQHRVTIGHMPGSGWPLTVALLAVLAITGRFRKDGFAESVAGALLWLLGSVIVGSVTFRLAHLVLPVTPAGYVAGFVPAAIITGVLFSRFELWGRVSVGLPGSGFGAAALPAPRRGQIWWAEVPFEEGSDYKDRPCLVLKGGVRSARVLMITSQDKSGRANYVPVSPTVWSTTPKQSYVRLDRQIVLPRTKFRRQEGPIDPGTRAAVARTFPRLGVGLRRA